jgi:CHAT domain-containing protein
LLIWLVSDRVFTLKSVRVSRASLDEKVNDFVARIRGKQDVSSRAQELHELLIAPLDGLLEPSEVVAIIPDLALHRLPFAALQDPQTKDYLVSHYTILESPNLTHLLTEAHKTAERDSIVVFGSRSGDASSGQEVAALAKTYSAAKSFTGDAAGKQAFLDEMKNASVFHYAGHSKDAANPLQSEILLDGDREGPNSVTALDISLQRMRPNALVVLASCDSSVGNSRDGIGVRGLTSAFLISGAGAVVGSLWPVDSAATSELVTHFHEAFATGRVAVASALRQAQLRFLRYYPQKNHPSYWSGFVVTGNTTAAATIQKPSLKPN